MKLAKSIPGAGWSAGAGYYVVVLVLALYVALEPVLALDTIARLLSRAQSMESGNLLLLLFYELTRVLRTILGLVLVILLLRHSSRRHLDPRSSIPDPLSAIPDPRSTLASRALILFLLFGLMAYGMAFSGSAYVGPFQDWLTRSLLATGLPRQALRIAFAYPDWALWLALAALLRFSVLFPNPLSTEAVAESGAQDRQGLLRGVPGAGVDVGGVFRRWAGVALRNQWLAAAPVWVFGLLGATVSVWLRGNSFKAILWLPFFLGLALAITCLRASYLRGDADARTRLLWIARGSLAAFVCYALSGVLGIMDNTITAVLGFVLLTVTPAALLFGIAMAVLQRRRSENVAPALS